MEEIEEILKDHPKLALVAGFAFGIAAGLGALGPLRTAATGVTMQRFIKAAKPLATSEFKRSFKAAASDLAREALADALAGRK